MSEHVGILSEGFDLDEAIAETKGKGYFFQSNALSEEAAYLLEYEAGSLYDSGQMKPPVNSETTGVSQNHDHFYTEYGDRRVVYANVIIEGLVRAIKELERFPELRDWFPKEVGYQRYSGEGYIDIHRDRATDKLLAATFTISGVAGIEIYQTINSPNDYSPGNVKLIDEFESEPRSIMLLRASGFGSGQRIPHKVLNPVVVPRNVLNLRMRSTILGQS